VAVFALGSYGVGEPRITSDLDLVVVADGVDLPDLMQRVQIINQWFTDGRILKLDFRLRAEGASAPLVQDLGFYEDYFRARASLWERVAFAKCAPWWGGDEIKRAFVRKLRAFVARPFTVDEVARLAEVRRSVEGIAPRHFSEWDTKRSAGGRYDLEYLTALGMSTTCAERLDYFTMTTRERIDALVGTGFLSNDQGGILRDAADRFTLVEHLMELQEMTHPGSEDKAGRLAHYMSRVFETLGVGSAPAADRLGVAKAGVRRVFADRFQPE
jgi:glutamate-ammonia-ligase adenylyltransferase